ncbi:hypothetical protein BDV97DRAFT_351329 [Delphinella strobiligena]|nr:hypothetical protein BDV97DRAFT_351329 [Delphinella strobiligena]
MENRNLACAKTKPFPKLNYQSRKSDHLVLFKLVTQRISGHNAYLRLLCRFRDLLNR